MSSRRFNPEMLAALAVRLTERDRRLLRLVWEHRVLTSWQLAQLAFGHEATARKRILRLTGFGVLERFRPTLPLGDGTTPYHYVIGEVGAAVLAAEDGVPLGDFGYRRDRVLSIAYSPKLAHTVGVNGFFTALTAYARRTPDATLASWWSERRCEAFWGAHARPDAYGQWTELEDTVDFFLEHDTGSETLDKVTRKLNGYGRLAASTGINTPVLFSLHSQRREANLRDRLLTTAGPIPIATTHRPLWTDQQGPAGAVWLPLEPAWIPLSRYLLAELKHALPHRQPADTGPEVRP